MEKITNRKVIYFGDYMYSGSNESLKDEFFNEIHPQFIKEGIEFTKIEFTESPVTDINFDILLFDWGGASLGNSFMDSYIRHIIKMATLYPSKIFIMVSSMTSWAMKDAIEDGVIYDNIFLNPIDFCKYWKSLT